MASVFFLLISHQIKCTETIWMIKLVPRTAAVTVRKNNKTKKIQLCCGVGVGGGRVFHNNTFSSNDLGVLAIGDHYGENYPDFFSEFFDLIFIAAQPKIENG